MSKLNIELFKKVRDRIATIPESYRQSSWWASSTDAPCGTAACLAGEAIICAAPTIEEGIAELKALVNEERDLDVPERAAELLGLEGNYWSQNAGETEIFQGFGEGWPEPYRSQFSKANDQGDVIGMAKAAVAYLDHIIETGKVLE